MYKLLLVFFMVISSPLYSNEFTFHCDNDELQISIIYKVDRKEKTVVWTHSIDKQSNEVLHQNIDLKVYHWDEKNDSVWFIKYEDRMSPSFVNIVLLNFEVGTRITQTVRNLTPRSEERSILKGPFYSSKSDCYIL
jgi:hypothetical protein